jgi:hypothetical protein
LIEKVDGIIDSFDRGGYDPFLCAQDVPGEFAVEDAAVSGEEASVVVHGVWNPGTEYESMNDVKVSLLLMEGEWRIADVACER